MIVEAMAQTAGVLVVETLDMIDQGLLVYFMTLDKTRFRQLVVPGDVLRMDITTLRGGPGSKVWKFSGKATVDGQAAAQAEFSAMIDPTGGKETDFDIRFDWYFKVIIPTL